MIEAGRLVLLLGLCLALACAHGDAPTGGPGTEPPTSASDSPRRDVASIIAEVEARQRVGDLEGAGRLADRAVEGADARGDTRTSAAALAVRGHLALARGELERAEPDLARAIELAARSGDARLEAAARLTRAHVKRRTGDAAAALRGYARAAEVAAPVALALAARAEASALRVHAESSAETGAKRVQAESSAVAGGTRDDSALLASSDRLRAYLGEIEDPRERVLLGLHAARSLLIAIERKGNASSEESPLVDVADDLLSLALESASRLGDPVQVSEVLGQQGLLARRRGQDALALARTEEALLTLERSGHEAAQIRWHVQASALHRRAGRRDAAIEQHARAVALLAEHRGAFASPATDLQAAPDSRDGADRLREVYIGYVDLLLERASETRDPVARRDDLARARDTIERFKAAELRDYFDDECVDRYRGRIRTVDEVAPGSIVLYPILLPDRLELLVSGRFGFEQRTVAVSEQTVRETAEAFRQLLAKRTTRQFRRPARHLYDWLLRPVEDLLEAQEVETLVFVPDAVLRTIPLAALIGDDGFVVERFAVATTPGIELTDPNALDRAELDALIGGLTTGSGAFEALPHVARELERIHDLVGGELLVDEDFAAGPLARRIAERDYDLVHLATHARFDDASTSGFLVTHDGRMGLDQLAEALAGDRYREKPLELLVLSACETALGNERAALGLSGIAIKAGARSAIGSLWRVNDAAAAALLIGFYEALREPGTSRADALRRAQLGLIEGDSFRHPAYWSAFLLLNSWL